MLTNTSSTSHDLTTLAESFILMDTVVTMRVVGHAGVHEMRDSIDRAIAAMRAVEDTCSRFDEESALRALCRQPQTLVPVPPILYHALQIARQVSEMTDGVFDPTVGRKMELLGFNRNYLTGEEVSSGIAADSGASFRDITLVEDGFQVRLEKPMLLDLGAVAKGLAVDLAAKELQGYEGFAIDAGGDVYVSGVDPQGEVWRVGIENPANPETLLGHLQLTGAAVCTSGNYKRRSATDPAVHHLLNPITGKSAEGLLSCTVVGPQAVLTDVTATAAFLLGPERAMSFIEEMGLAGLFMTNNLEVHETASMGEYRQ